MWRNPGRCWENGALELIINGVSCGTIETRKMEEPSRKFTPPTPLKVKVDRSKIDTRLQKACM